MADKILEMNPRSELYCASKSSCQCSSNSSTTMDDLVAKIVALEQQIAAIPIGKHRSRTLNRSPGRSRSRGRFIKRLIEFCKVFPIARYDFMIENT